jgi:hypothetical protein
MFESTKITSRSSDLVEVAALDLLEHLLDVRHRELVHRCSPDDVQLATGVHHGGTNPSPAISAGGNRATVYDGGWWSPAQQCNTFR